MIDTSNASGRCQCELVLASRSPRRASLLTDAGLKFRQLDPPYADPPQPNHDDVDHNIEPETLAAGLAKQKALSLIPHVPANSVILAADTICIGGGGQMIGQPQTTQEAQGMLAGFVSSRHAVVTGVVVREPSGKIHQFADRAYVVFGALSNEAIAHYVVTERWRGKAGGYNLFERQSEGWPIETEGDPTTIVGLPMQRLLPVLEALHICKSTVESR